MRGKDDWDKIKALVVKTDKDTLKKVVSNVDGHTIYDPRKFLEVGLDAEIVAAFTKKQYSGVAPKEKIYVKGDEVISLDGVYGLEILEYIANCFGIESWKLGRGSRADHLCEQLLEQWEK